jgi:indolepyruvate ferredoxin oxidoreductase
VIGLRAEFLVGYQNAAYADAYTAFVQKVRAKEEAVLAKSSVKTLRLTEAVAIGLFKLMAYKDEYEVARLHTDATFHAKIATMFEGDYKLHFHLAPPLLAKTNAKGELQKQKFGPAMLTGFKLLAKLKGLRGGAFDMFGRSEERRTERALITEYQASINDVLELLTPANHTAAIAIARIPEQIKGYGHVKARHLTSARANWVALMAAYFNPPEVVKQAA